MRPKGTAKTLPRCPIIGVTGSIASGKSTFTAALGRLGAIVLDADVLAREVVGPGSAALTKIAEHLGTELITGGQLDRGAVARIVFADPAKRKWLEELLHPLIRKRFLSRLQEIAAQPAQPPLIVYAAPLLIEAGVPDFLTSVILVSAPRATLLDRAAHRGGLTREHVEARLARQMPDQEKRLHANIIVDNSGTPQELENEASRLYEQLVQISNKDSSSA